MQKKQNNQKSGAAAEKAAREARSTKATKAAPAKAGAGKGTKAPARKATKKAASANGNGHKTDVDLTDPDVKLLASYQDKTTTERMTGANMIAIYRRIKAATLDKPVVNKDLNLYDKRQARELGRLGLVQKEKVEGIGLAYFGK